MASKEFTAKNHLGQEECYTPQRVTYNGREGHFWKRTVFKNGVWIYQGQTFHGLKATRKEIAG